ncbi:MAG: tRNA pseudouridine(55) synthase TruB [Anaerolineales bacterium]
MSSFGVIVVDKPKGPTSHKVVSIVRRGTRVRKVGHAGTLDPRASGVLVLCLGPATRLSEYLSTSTKTYEARIHFGESTETYDAEGETTSSTGEVPTEVQIESALEMFRGEIQQVPPSYSAIKLQGKKAYELAREGRPVELDPRNVTVYELTKLEYEPPELSVRVECSAGTYIRSLAHDLGEVLSTGAHLSALRRLRAGPFGLEDAVSLEALEEAMRRGEWHSFLRPASEALPDLPIVTLQEPELEKIRNGLRIPSRDGATGMARALAPDGELVAILVSAENGREWQPRKVFLS